MMARVAIYDRSGVLKTDSNGQQVSGKVKYVGQTMSASYVEITVAGAWPVAWNVGDYVEYGAGLIGEADVRFMLFTVPQPKKDAEGGLYGGGFVYSGMQFHDPTQILSLAPYTDMQVKNDDLIHFSTRDGLSTFENVAGVCARLQSCLDAYRLGLAADDPMRAVKFYLLLCTSDTDAYERTVPPSAALGGEDAEAYEELVAEARSVSIQGSVLDGLNDIQGVWPSVGWDVRFHTCSFGNQEYDTQGRLIRTEDSASGAVFTLSYRNTYNAVPGSVKDGWGQECGTLPERIVLVRVGCVNFVGNAGASARFARHSGLVSVRRYISNQDEFLTRLVPYGSDRNMEARHYNGKEIFSADSVDIPNLMLPLSEWGKSYGRVHDSAFGIDYTTTLNADGSIATAKAEYNNATHRYTYSYDSDSLIYEVRDKTGALVATGDYTASSFPGTEVLPQTYQEPLRLLPDARKSFIESREAVSRYGVITRTVRFDNDDDGDIYPTIQGLTLSDVISVVGLSNLKPTKSHPTAGLVAKQVNGKWVSYISGLDDDVQAEMSGDSSYRVMLLRYGYARRGQWFPRKGSVDGNALRKQNPRADGESTHATRRYPGTTKVRRYVEPFSYQDVRRGYSNTLQACRYRVIGWDILIHGSMPSSSQQSGAGIYSGASLATRLGGEIVLPGIRKHDVYERAGTTWYRNSAKDGLTDLYIGLFHYERDGGWTLVSNVRQVRGRVPLDGSSGALDCSKVWFGNVDNVVLGGQKKSSAG